MVATIDPSEDDVMRLKLLYTQFLQALGRRLRLRQQVVATAVVYFRRFYKSPQIMAGFDPLLMAPTALWMASKVEETTVTVKAVVREAKEVARLLNVAFQYAMEHLVDAEYTMLAALSDLLAVRHPHPSLSHLLAQADLRGQLGAEKADCFVQTAWFLLNDTYRTDLPLLQPPDAIALACACVAGLLEHADTDRLLPVHADGVPERITSISETLLALYEHCDALSPGTLSAVHERMSLLWVSQRVRASEQAQSTEERERDGLSCSCASEMPDAMLPPSVS